MNREKIEQVKWMARHDPKGLLIKIRKWIGRMTVGRVRDFTYNVVRKHSVTDPRKIAIMTNTFRYTCNPKYIYEEIVRQGLDYDIVWIAKKGETLEDYPPDARIVHLGTLECAQQVYRAKIWLDNGIAFSNFFEKKEDQIHIQTMHGSLGIKRLDNAVLSRNQAGKHGQTVVERESKNTDYVITNSQFEEDVFRTIFWKKTPMRRLGHARTDILFGFNPDIQKRVRAKLCTRYGIPENKKIVLYGPTHRSGLEFKDIDIDYPAMLTVLKRRFGGEYVVLLRLHDRIRNIMLSDRTGENVYDVTDYPDMQELMLVADIGITDYSSWIFDYVLTRRPGFIFATDLERYNNKTGLYYPLEETPFPVCRSNRELMEKMETFDLQAYIERVEAFLSEKQSVDDGKSAERIVNWMKTIAPTSMMDEVRQGESTGKQAEEGATNEEHHTENQEKSVSVFGTGQA